MPDPVPSSPLFSIRTFLPQDQEQCSRLFVDGLISGRIHENDTGLDIHDIQLAYMKSPESSFWVAQNASGEIVGMIGVQRFEAGVGEIRRLRVRQDHRRRGIGTALMGAAIKFCHDHGYIKITLDTFMEREPAISLFEKFSFVHSRTRKVGEKELLYFYLDLYHSERREDV